MLKVIFTVRAIFVSLFIVVHTLLCSLVVVTMLVLKFPKRFVDFIIGPIWCGWMVRAAGIKVETQGVDLIPKDKGFLYLFTHSSHMDIPVMFDASPKPFRFGAKDSLFKIPVFGYAVKLSGTLRITREDRKKVMEVYREAEARVAKGEAFALAPEGTRRVGDEIKEFKSGPFIFAINAKMPIVPVVLCGVDKVLPKASLLPNKDRWSRSVGVQFLPPIETKNIPLEEMKTLKEDVRQQMVAAFEKLKTQY